MKRRGGFSLLEVLIATAVLLGCVVVMAEIAHLGRLHAQDAENLTKAQLICQSRLNEMLAGAVPVAAVEREELVEMPGWILSIEVEPAKLPTLAVVRVKVGQEILEGQLGKQFMLTRWLPDPGQAAGDQSSELAPLEEPF